MHNSLKVPNLLRKKPVISGNLRKRHFQVFCMVPCHSAATREVAKRKKTGIFAKNEKTGSVGKSTLPGVEVAGFDTVRSIVAQSPWSGLCSPFRANKLGAFPALPDSPLG